MMPTQEPPRPGPKPPWWRFLKLRKWRKVRDRRNDWKAARFMEHYGARPEKLKEFKQIDTGEAEDIMQRYFDGLGAG